MSSLKDVLSRQNREIDAMTSGFEGELERMLFRAQARVQSSIMSRLSFVDGKIARTSANRALLRKVGETFMDEMNGLGLGHLTDAFVSKFGGQFRFFKEVLDITLGETDAERIVGSVSLDEDDRHYLSMSQSDAAESLRQTVSDLAGQLRTKSLLNLGGLTARGLADLIASETETTLGRSRTLAATNVSSFYRNMADASFRKIEQDWELRYSYVGPPASDPIIRPFCERLMTLAQKGRTWTRDEIEAMDNHQLEDVFVTGGGYNCRHQWIVAKATERDRRRGLSPLSIGG